MLSNPLTFYTVVGTGIFLLLGALLAVLRFEVAWRPYKTWFFLLPPVFAAWWLGPWGWAIFVSLISIFAFKEFARATGLYREAGFVLIVYISILFLNIFAVLAERHYFMVVPLWAVVAMTLIPVLRNRTDAMLQWFSLAVVGAIYFAWFLSHLTYMVNSPFGIGVLIYVVLATQFNDALAFLFGKKFGRRHWTVLSPNKTVEGSLLALLASIVLAFLNWPVAFPWLPWYGVLSAGAIISVGGQVGDLTMANVKRNLGIKDFGAWLPGHGGLLDRVNSLMLVAPVFTHFFNFFFGAFP